MITTIILTVVLSVLSTLALGYFTWIGLGLRKAQRQGRSNKDAIADLFKNQGEFGNQITEEVSRLYIEINEKGESIRHDMDERFSGVDKTFEDSASELDRRFDKLYRMLYLKFPDLRDSEKQVTA
jgi:predicted  nucleic acid-binding Zn-ribbon protein